MPQHNSRDATRGATEDTEILHLSPKDQRQFAEALLKPPPPNAALRRAAKRYRRLFGA